MMGKTYDKNAGDVHRVWIFPFARLVLRYEKMLTSKEWDENRTGISDGIHDDNHENISEDSQSPSGSSSLWSKGKANSVASDTSCEKDSTSSMADQKSRKRAEDKTSPPKKKGVREQAECQRCYDVEVEEVDIGEDDDVKQLRLQKERILAKHSVLVELFAERASSITKACLATLRPGQSDDKS